MTKLFEWFMAAACFLSVYFAIILRQVKHDVLEQYMLEIQLSPIFLVLIFGLYSATVVLYRTFTFNNCEEAAKELMEQIKEAKADLRRKGLVLSD
ncbi:dolichol-phosphate mannosyltransferase subunit 3 [Anopheles stephensi]|uniref:Dolichol-phosphate mannosyltransferase subunit 3 n=1 Tax=Anopheles stephensi TaxID=30069 RepID=A0A182Y8M9_ANOST|nr:dolichol-phosphate mannosyltransferase subunit 3 [Anopheles stephensi]XP_035901862.1 dolichol-phosphate mannosyltransferase subunit 3 [Anopheles stephensi]